MFFEKSLVAYLEKGGSEVSGKYLGLSAKIAYSLQDYTHLYAHTHLYA